MIKIKQEIHVYYLDGDETFVSGPIVQINSHWNRNEIVEIEVGGHRYGVNGDDLLVAIKNAMNTNRF